jgi:hypothetical protein
MSVFVAIAALASGFGSSLAGAGGVSVDPGTHLPSAAYFSCDYESTISLSSPKFGTG